MKKTTLLFIASGLFMTGIYSCKTTKSVPPPVTVTCIDPKPTYSADIKPILDTHCASSCHSAKNHAGNIDLSSYEGSKSVSEKKRFLGAIRHEAGFEAMPKKNPKLGDDDILKIACWVQGGSVQ